MKRVATHTTLLALLASLLILVHSTSPGADESALDEVAEAEGAPLPLDAAATGEKPPLTTPADVLPAETRPEGSIPADTAVAETPVVEPPDNDTSAAAQDNAHPDNTNVADALPERDAQATDAEPVQGDAAPAPVDASEAPTEPVATDPASASSATELAVQSPESATDPMSEQTPHTDGIEPADEMSASSPGVNPWDLGLAVDTLSTIDPMGTHMSDVPLAEAVMEAEERTAEPLNLLHGQVPPGTYQRLSWAATELFEGVPVTTPVLVVNGRLPGPTLCLTAAVHGDELNGIEMVRRVMHNLEPQELSGAVIGVPIVNLQGFRRGSRYLPDRRDLNRYFPGNPQGSQASRIAFSFFTEVVTHCDALIDLHTGSFERANLPQLRADLRNPDVVTLTQGFGATVILHSDPANGTLRYAATSAGIPTVTLEAGGPSELELKEVMHGVKGIETLLNTLGMVKKIRLWGDPEPVYYRSTWVRANSGGILLSDVSLGSTVRRGDLLGTITDPMSNASTNLYSPYSGRIIGMARNQVVMPGFAAFHVGIQTVEATAADSNGADADTALEHESELSNEDYIDGMSE